MELHQWCNQDLSASSDAYRQEITWGTRKIRDHLRGLRSFSAFKHDNVLPEAAPRACYKAQFSKLYLEKPLAAATSHLVLILCRVTVGSRGPSDSSGLCNFSKIGRKADLMERAHTEGPDKDFLIKGTACCVSATFAENVSVFFIN